MEAHIYQSVSKDKLFDMIRSLQICFDLPMQLRSETGDILETFGEIPQFCSVFEHGQNDKLTCPRIYDKSSRIAYSLGEPYIFSCPAGMYNIVIPLIVKDTMLASLRVGPFLMNRADAIFMSDLADRLNLPMTQLFELADYADEVPYLLPAKVSEISKVIFYLMQSVTSASGNDYEVRQNKMHQQAKISESIQMFKSFGTGEADPYPYETEKELIQSLKNKDFEHSESLLNELLGSILYIKGTDTEYSRIRSLELISLLSRASIEGGAKADLIFKLNNRFMDELYSAENTDDLCYCLQQAVQCFSECMFYQVPGQNKKIIQKAIEYLSTHYSENITLEEVAEIVHLNPSYFSTLFKHSTGTTFKEYLTTIRMEESKNLLANTDFSITDIALAVGYSNHSYFSSLFFKYTGMTPKKFRK